MRKTRKNKSKNLNIHKLFSHKFMLITISFFIIIFGLHNHILANLEEDHSNISSEEPLETTIDNNSEGITEQEFNDNNIGITNTTEENNDTNIIEQTVENIETTNQTVQNSSKDNIESNITETNDNIDIIEENKDANVLLDETLEDVIIENESNKEAPNNETINQCINEDYNLKDIKFNFSNTIINSNGDNYFNGSGNLLLLNDYDKSVINLTLNIDKMITSQLPDPTTMGETNISVEIPIKEVLVNYKQTNLETNNIVSNNILVNNIENNKTLLNSLNEKGPHEITITLNVKIPELITITSVDSKSKYKVGQQIGILTGTYKTNINVNYQTICQDMNIKNESQ